MAQHAFRLESLMKLRVARRDSRRGELAAAYQAEQILRQRIRQLDEELQHAKTRARKAAQPGSVDVDLLLGAHRYELALRARASLLQRQNEQLAAEIERRREALTRADRDVRVLEKLRDRQLAEYVQQQWRFEMQQIDEAALRQAAKRAEQP